VRLAGTGEVSACHLPTDFKGHPIPKYYWKDWFGAIGIL
jgi:hypothetical protein